MYAGKDIGGGVNGVQVSDHVHENVVPRKIGRAQIKPIGKDKGNDQKQGHSNSKGGDQAVVIRAVFAEYSKIDHCSRYIEEPQKVRDNEIFTEGNILVRTKGDLMDVHSCTVFYIIKYRHVK